MSDTMSGRRISAKYGPMVLFKHRSLSERHPVFHRWQPGAYEDDDRWRGRTKCGLLSFDGGQRIPWIMEAFPAKHAVKFATPCRRCWP